MVRSISKWITTLVSVEESSIQVEVAFTDALQAEDLWQAADERATDALVAALASADRAAVATVIDDGQLPLLLAISDNGPQMRSLVGILHGCLRHHTT
ncbi:MAG: hypothetical protein ACSLE7_04560 [Mycobacterium sp.]